MSALLEAVKRPLGGRAGGAAARGTVRSRSGPGSAAAHEERALVRRLLEETDLPAVVDADALYGLEPFERVGADGADAARGRARPAARPRVGVGRRAPARGGAARRRSGSAASCLLKGADTLVAAPGRGSLVCRLGHVRRSRRPGTGDVLTGVIAAFLAKGVDARFAAAAGSDRLRRGGRGTGRNGPDRLRRARCFRSRWVRIETMARSELTIDLGAIRRNATALLARARRRRALGGRQGRRLRARRGRRRRRRARRRRDGALRRDGRRGARAAARVPDRAHPRHGPGVRTARSRRRATPGSSCRRRRAPIPEGIPLHLKLDTGMGRWGLAELPVAAARGRRPDEPPRDRRHRSRVRRAPDRALPRGDRAVSAAHAPRREQRRRAADPRVAASTRPAAGSRSTGSRRSARDPAEDGLEPVLRWRSELAQVKRLAAGREHRLRPPLRRRRGRPGSASSRSATRTASGAT